MHTRLLQVMPWPDSDAPEVQAVVHFSRSWHTATMAHTGRRLVRVPNTPRWSHGGGLFRDPSSDETFTVQSLWPITDEPDLFPDEAEDDSSPFTWRFTAIETDPTATARAGELDHAERRKNARLMRRPATHPAERITIRLMPEYGVAWPLWVLTAHSSPGSSHSPTISWRICERGSTDGSAAPHQRPAGRTKRIACRSTGMRSSWRDASGPRPPPSRSSRYTASPTTNDGLEARGWLIDAGGSRPVNAENP